MENLIKHFYKNFFFYFLQIKNSLNKILMLLSIVFFCEHFQNCTKICNQFNIEVLYSVFNFPKEKAGYFYTHI